MMTSSCLKLNSLLVKNSCMELVVVYILPAGLICIAQAGVLLHTTPIN